MQEYTLTDNEYATIQKLLFKETGISLGENKYNMVKARLLKRLHHYKVNTYSEYLKIVQLSRAEKTEFLNQLSTNETYFFREQEHFDFLAELCQQGGSMRIWSAAASQGAEAYSIAMTLASAPKVLNWEVIGTDINTEVITIAQKGLYPLHWIEKIPVHFQKSFCFKGEGRFEGKLLIDPALSNHVSFLQHNLMKKNPMLGLFDVIFVRNVLLYFDETTKLHVIGLLLKHLKIGGTLIISMTETFNDRQIPSLEYVKNSIYKKVG